MRNEISCENQTFLLQQSKTIEMNENGQFKTDTTIYFFSGETGILTVAQVKPVLFDVIYSAFILAYIGILYLFLTRYESKKKR